MLRTYARHKRALLTPLLTLAAAAGLAVAPATSAHAEPTEPTTLTVSLSRSYGVYYDGVGPAIPDDTFVVRGRLTSNGTNLAGKTIQLYRQLKTETGDFTPVATTTTNAEGVYSFPQRVVGSAQYGVDFAGDETYVYARSANAPALPAMRDFNATKRKVDGKLFFRGNINPGWNNRTIKLQKKACGTCAWRTVASKATGSTGGWSFRVSYPRNVGPVWRWQAVIAATGNFEKSYSAILTTRRVYN